MRLALLLLLIGCGGGGAKPDAAVSAHDAPMVADAHVAIDTVPADVAIDANPNSSGTLKVTGNLGLVIDPRFALSGSAQIFVKTLAGVAIDDATVTLTKDGVDLALTKDVDNPGSYSVFWQDSSIAYKLSVAHGSDFLRVDGLVEPGAPTITLAPDQPALTTPITETWTHPDDLANAAYTAVLGPNMAFYISDVHAVETGTFTLPASAFAASGNYEIQLIRSQQVKPDAASYVEVDTVTNLLRAIP